MNASRAAAPGPGRLDPPGTAPASLRLRRLGLADPDLVEGRRGLRKECIEIHIAPLQQRFQAQPSAGWRWATSDLIVGARVVNGALKSESRPRIGSTEFGGGARDEIVDREHLGHAGG